ncbi:MAG: helix-turn-helix transcriptional regulator [Phycisphaerales bacterium]|nr:helix-turn-helix transcriptional regulator [Phycisphaerales bacterium]
MQAGNLLSPQESARTVVMRIIGQLIRARRAEQRLTLRALAERARCTPGYLSQIETGKTPRLPSHALLTRLERALARAGHARRTGRRPPTPRRSARRTRATPRGAHARRAARHTRRASRRTCAGPRRRAPQAHPNRRPTSRPRWMRNPHPHSQHPGHHAPPHRPRRRNPPNHPTAGRLARHRTRKQRRIRRPSRHALHGAAPPPRRHRRP